MGDAGEISSGEIGFRWRAGEGNGEEGDDRWVRSVSGARATRERAVRWQVGPAGRGDDALAG